MRSLRKVLLLIVFAISFHTLSSQSFVTREGTLLKYQGEEILLRGFAFGNRVWIGDPLPNEHHGEEDYQEVNEMGLNAVRFYLNYLTFEDEENPYTYKEEGWEWIDQNISWAKKHDVFLILNIHVPQGGFQSQCEGTALWEEQENQERLVALWKAIAERYKDETQIAGYDILNEPTPTESVEQWSLLAQEIIDNIRSVDDNHLIIAERAIAIDCDYGYNDGNHNYPDITEDNLMYTVHFYDPHEYTHQMQEWANTGDGGTYPDENEITEPSDITYATGNYSNPSLPEGDTEWTYFEGSPFKIEGDSLIMGRVVFIGNNLESGTAYYDDIRLIETDENGEEIREIHNSDISSTPSIWFWSEENDGEQSMVAGRQSGNAIRLSGTSGKSSVTVASLSFQVEEGKYYKISGWMKGEEIPAEAFAIITTEFQYSPSGQGLSFRNYDYLKERILEYSKYIRDQGFPVYYGEFGVVRAAFEDDKGGERWVRDVVEIFDELGFHYTYHVWREGGFGYYDGWDGHVDRSTRNDALKEIFIDSSTRVLYVEEKEIEEGALKVFPNPYKDDLNLYNTGSEALSVTLIDNKGEQLWEESLLPNEQKSFNKNIPQGIYIIKVLYPSGNYSTKVVKN
ncbi:cellulase family glycosylhydrolase [Cytophagaceae bacterium ABcell3]|nr:cellulase family glycosylhydrolase [Cytophagaceae bacterium ABcell3]